MLHQKLLHVASQHGEHVAMISYAFVEVLHEPTAAPGIISVFLVMFGIMKFRSELRSE